MLMKKRGKGTDKKAAEAKKGSKQSNEENSKQKNGSGIKINKDIIELASGFTVKRVVSMVGMLGIDPLTKDEILEINRKLNKVKKK